MMSDEFSLITDSVTFQVDILATGLKYEKEMMKIIHEKTINFQKQAK